MALKQYKKVNHSAVSFRMLSKIVLIVKWKILDLQRPTESNT